MRAAPLTAAIALIVSVLVAASFGAPAAVADTLFRAAGSQGGTPTLQQRRSAARDAEIRKLQRHCRVLAKEFKSFRNRKCLADDRLEPRANLCHPRKARYQSYSRWDMAAGRCKPRHRFDGGSCAGGKRRYNPGKHHAQSAARSARMFARAPARARTTLDQCRVALIRLRRHGAAQRAVRQKDCRDARLLKRRDLIQLYCR